MDIIKQANIEVECPKCNAVLRVYYTDVIENDCDSNVPSYYCCCASCNKVIDLSHTIPNCWKG